MDPYQHIKAKYPGEVSALALLLPTLDALDTFRVANDLHWLLEEVERLRADATALAEVTFSLRYAIGQWTAHGPPEDFDALAWVENMRDMIEDVRQRALRS